MNAIYKFFELGTSLPMLTDWIQAISSALYTLITLFGAIYIVRTFRLQARINEQQRLVNAQQATLNSLSLEKHRREIRPEFIVKSCSADSFYLILENAIALRVVLFETDSVGKDIENTMEIYPVWHPNKNASTLGFPKDRGGNMEMEIFNIYFHDEDGRQYSQTISMESRKAFITFPKLQGLAANTVVKS